MQATQSKRGIVKSLSRPEGNITGVASFALVRLGLLRDLKHPATVAVLTNPKSPTMRREIEALQKASTHQGEHLLVLDATNELDIDSGFSTLRNQEAGGLLVQSGPLFTAKREKIVALAARYNVPTVYAQREFVDIGGLMSYGVNFLEIYRQLGVYTGRVLKGERPVDLAVLQPTKFDFVINLRTAKALGLNIPSGLIAIADERSLNKGVRVRALLQAPDSVGNTFNFLNCHHLSNNWRVKPLFNAAKLHYQHTGGAGCGHQRRRVLLG